LKIGVSIEKASAGRWPFYVYRENYRGSIREAATVWTAMELSPLQTRLTALNEWLGDEVIRFNPFDLGAAA